MQNKDYLNMGINQEDILTILTNLTKKRRASQIIVSILDGSGTSSSDSKLMTHLEISIQTYINHNKLTMLKH